MSPSLFYCRLSLALTLSGRGCPRRQSKKRRREILTCLAGGERPVGEIVAALGMEQPFVSKHLEFAGPLFASFPFVSNVQYRLSRMMKK
jgi:hypothetical protein